MKRILLLTGISLLINVQHATAQDFADTPISFGDLGWIWGEFAWADLDGDGDLDALTANWVDKVKTFKNENGTLVQVGVGLGDQPFSYNDQFRLVDFDNNGYIDVLLWGGGKVHALLNQGNFDFVLQPTGIDFVPVRSTPLDCIDIDADADLDIILDGRIFLNTDGTFAESIVAFPEISKYIWGDINNDGLIDLIDVYYNTLVPYIGEGNGVFTKGTAFGSIRSDGTFFLVDADGDGDLDIQVSESNYTRSIFRNSFKQNGKVEFERAYTFPVSGGIATVSPGDVNRDGLVDFVVYGLASISKTTMILINTSSGGQMSFTTGNFMLSAELRSNPTLVDFDSDGDLDIHLSTLNASGVGSEHKIYLNEQASPVVPAPQVPANPQTLTGDEVTLKWDAAPHTLYSIEIERNGVKTLPSSSMDDGTLMLSFPAQSAIISEHKLKNLPAGNYRWRVQAVDYASRASAFTAYQNFTIEAAPLAVMLRSNDFTSVTLSWQHDGIATGFAIYRRSSREPWKKFGEVPVTMTSLNDNTLVLNETYEYFVKSVNGTSYSAPSTAVSYYSGQFKETPFARRNPNIIVGGGDVADIDADGDHDLQIIGRVDWGNETAMDNDGAGNFSMKSYLPDTGTDWDKAYSGLLFMGDVDSDGDIDMCVRIGDNWGMKIQVLSNNGGTFSKTYESPVINYMYDYEVKDFNNDGLIDIFLAASVSSGSGYYYKFLIQKRDGSFSSEILSLGQELSGGRWFKTVDINHDGFVDLFFGGRDYPNNKAMLAINLNGRAFQVRETEIFAHADMIFQDLNADGFLDLLYKHADSRLVMHLGQGSEVFGDPVFFRAFYLTETRLASADLDFNGWPELILYDGYNIGVMQNNGNGAFEVAPYKFSGRWGTFVHLLDLENDGDLDIVRMANNDQHQGMSSLHTNQWKSDLRTNTPPTAPTTVTSTMGNGSVKIQWEPSTDNTTPSKLISYNVLITDANGKSWVHPGTNASGTWRNVTGQGNAGNRLFFFVNELPAGTYTVKVQALDASFAMSGWSEPHSFTIEAGPTGLTVERILLNKIKLQWTAGTAGGDHVIVERKTPSTDYEVVADLSAGSVEYIDAELSYNQLFTYRVRELVGSVATTHSNTVTWNTALWELKDTALPNADGAMDVGDFNADGHMDLLLAGYYSDGNNYTRVKAAFANTDSGFVATNFGDLNQPPTVSAFFEDLNMDGMLDIYEHGWNNGYQTNLYTRNGGTFNSFTNIMDSENLELLSGIDYDMDNDLDLYVAEKPYSGAPSAKMLQNTGSGYQAVTVLVNTCQGYYCTLQAVAGDFDRDGDEDIIRYAGGFGLYLNTPEGFQATSITFGTTVQGYVSVVDFNGDGWPDVLFLTTDGNYYKSKLYKNLGMSASQSLQFEEVKVTLPAGSSSLVSNNAADFDNDGDLDFVFVGPEITMLLNNNNGGFETATIPNFRVSGKSKSIDYDRDGDLDIIFTGYMSENYNSLYSKVAKVLENKLIDGGKGVLNNAPAAPTNLRSYQDAEGLHLEWDAPQDDHTPSSALTYDVVLYKGGVPVYKNYLDPSTGMRKKLAAGRSMNKVLLNNIVNGDYEWKVQAVDQNYLASPFSDVKAFTMLPSPPGVKDTTIYRCNRTVTLTARGENIQWYSDANTTNLLATGTFSPATSQKVYVTQTIGGVRGVAAEVNITIIERPEKPALLLASPVYYCASYNNYALYLAANGENLSWYTDSNQQTKVATGSYYYAPAKPAKYFITQSIQQCQSLPAEIVVDSIGIDSRIVLEQDRLRLMEEKADHYNWYRNGTLIASGPSNSIPFDGTTGQYRAAIYKRGCYEASGPFLVTGIEEEAPDLISIYPNPATHETTIRLTSGAHLQIYSGEGRLVYRQENSSAKELKLAVSAWQKGIYAVVVSDGNRSHVRKLVIR